MIQPGEVCFAEAVEVAGFGTAPSGIAAADIDGDGHQDIVTGNVGSNDVTVAWGDGMGGLEVGPSMLSGLQPRNVAVGDFDGDELPDIAAANLQTDYVAVYLHTSAREFADQDPNGIGIGGRCRDVAVGDIDDDGDLDMVAIGEDSETLEVFLGMGDGSFSSSTEFAVGPQPYSVALGDFDGDDQLDAAVANLGEGSVSVLLADGAGGYQEETRYQSPSDPSGEGSRSVALGDFSGDGEIDVIAASLAALEVGVLPGDGEGGFDPYVPFPVGLGPYAVFIADMNSDDDTDLVSVSRNSGEVSILVKNGDAFAEYTYGVGNNPLEVAVADFNEDGVPDMAVPGSLSPTSAVSVILSDP